MQLGVPTLSGVGVEDVWNDLHEFSADGFSALDDVLPDVSAPHAVLQASGKCMCMPPSPSKILCVWIELTVLFVACSGS